MDGSHTSLGVLRPWGKNIVLNRRRQVFVLPYCFKYVIKSTICCGVIAASRPSGIREMPGLVRDLISLRNTGILFGEMFALDDLARACAEDRRYAFLFTAAPLPITGAVGSPINPLAIR